jgi:regulator of RNase E activity RraA
MAVDTSFSAEDLQALTQWDTPTICNGLELVCPERRATGFTTEPLVSLDPSLAPVVGYARTATIRAAAPSVYDAEKNKALRTDYYDYVADGERPAIVVIQDLDATPGYGAFWGEVNTHIHRGLGVAGCVTNGSMRDIPDSASGFQLLANRVGPSHAHVHVTGFGSDVTVHNMTVTHNDIVHMDQHGAVVVPAHAVQQLPAAIDLISRREAVILDAAKSPDFNIVKLRQALKDAGEIH